MQWSVRCNDEMLDSAEAVGEPEQPLGKPTPLGKIAVPWPVAPYWRIAALAVVRAAEGTGEGGQLSPANGGLVDGHLPGVGSHGERSGGATISEERHCGRWGVLRLAQCLDNFGQFGSLPAAS